MVDQLLALAESGPQPLLLAGRITPDNALSGIENVLRRAIVLLKQDDTGLGEIALEGLDVFGTGAAPAIDHLVVVANHADIAAAAGPLVAAPPQQADQLILRHIAVLELVNMDILPALLVTRQDLGLCTPELLGEHQQIVEVDAIVGAQQLLIATIDP